MVAKCVALLEPLSLSLLFTITTNQHRNKIIYTSAVKNNKMFCVHLPHLSGVQCAHTIFCACVCVCVFIGVHIKVYDLIAVVVICVCIANHYEYYDDAVHNRYQLTVPFQPYFFYPKCEVYKRTLCDDEMLRESYKWKCCL